MSFNVFKKSVRPYRSDEPSIAGEFTLMSQSAKGNIIERTSLACKFGYIALLTLVAPKTVLPYLEELEKVGRDDITDLANHQLFSQLFNERMQESGKHALILFDLIDFKHINETHGQSVGDAALRAFSDALKSSIRSEDVVLNIGDTDKADLSYKEEPTAGRIGGDEFGMLLSDNGITSENLPAIALRKLETALLSDALADFMKEHAIDYLGARAGSVVLDESISTYDVAVTNADHKLHTQWSLAVKLDDGKPRLYHYVKAKQILNFIDNPLVAGNSDKILGSKQVLYDEFGKFSEDKSVYFIPVERRLSNP